MAADPKAPYLGGPLRLKPITLSSEAPPVSPSEASAGSPVADEQHDAPRGASESGCQSEGGEPRAWRPTHIHADGGEYRFVRHADGRADGHDPWSAGVVYEGADGRHWWTGNDRWFDRFTALNLPTDDEA